MMGLVGEALNSLVDHIADAIVDIDFDNIVFDDEEI
jgi:hypothetical protein